ncbi:magnesium transporter CorA family protein [Ferruginivarius sediminum]|uniref:magnesium transporter CorA family protein n=1 Tax=Ferruginivarius sediminum TaxID=2661937 RepID=UPI001F4E23F2|nr:magnesium transporter CorA family protein [Ferruginivarius sediminum]
MIRVYSIEQGRISVREVAVGGPWPADLVWIDLLQLDTAEEKAVEQHFGLDIPTREEMAEIEASSRLYHTTNASFMTATLVTNADTTNPESSVVTFIVTESLLITVRDADPLPFRTFTAHAQRHPDEYTRHDAVLLGLLEAVVDRLADILESAQAQLDDISREIFANRQGKAKPDYQDVLKRIGRNGDLISKARESLVSIARIGAFAQPLESLRRHKTTQAQIKTLQQDVSSLSDHASFLNTKVSLLLDATLGMISIEQNATIKIFSVVAVVFLPPTLIASIYGMNFRYMPELDWPFGYPLALLAMVISAILPYVFFKRRGWL